MRQIGEVLLNDGVTLLAGWFAYCAMSYFWQYPRWKVFRILWFLIIYGCVNLLITAGDMVNILGVFGALFLGTALFIKGKPVPKLSMAAIFFSISISVNGIGNGIAFFAFSGEDWRKFQWMLVFCSFTRALFWGAAYLLVRRHKKKESPCLPGRVWLLIDSLVCLPMASILIYLMGETFGDTTARTILMLVFTGISGIGAMVLVCVLDQNQKILEENHIWEMRNLYFKNLENEQMQIRRMRHDIRNHLQTLRGLESGQRDAYLKELLESPAIKSERHFCENPVIQTILSNKVQEMEQEEISWEIEVKIPGAVPVNDIELCAVFANSLDNAIEACRILPKEKRRIKVCCRMEKGMFMLQIDNTMAGEIKRQGKRLLTGKEDKKNHGLGTGEIQDICEKYQGTVFYGEENGIFSMRFVIPV